MIYMPEAIIAINVTRNRNPPIQVSFCGIYSIESDLNQIEGTFDTLSNVLGINEFFNVKMNYCI